MQGELSELVRGLFFYLRAGVRAQWWRGKILVVAAPIATGVFVLGALFGVLAVAARLPAWSVVLMSALVFAGSAQFAALGVIVAGGSVLAAIFAGALLNLRFLATGIAVARSLPAGRLLRSLLAQLSIDESYAMSVPPAPPPPPACRTFLLPCASLSPSSF